jgi:hypothetical protein
MCNPLIDAQWSVLKQNHCRASDSLASVLVTLTSADVSLGCTERHTVYGDICSDSLNKEATQGYTQVSLASATLATVFTTNIDFPIARASHFVFTSIEERTHLAPDSEPSSSYLRSIEVIRHSIECSNMVSAPQKTRGIVQLSVCLCRRGIGDVIIARTALIA